MSCSLSISGFEQLRRGGERERRLALGAAGCVNSHGMPYAGGAKALHLGNDKQNILNDEFLIASKKIRVIYNSKREIDQPHLSTLRNSTHQLIA
jgi:hypothetical protein